MSFQFLLSGFLISAANHPDRIAVRDGERQVTYGACLDLVRRYAGAYRAGPAGDAGGRPVAVIGDKSAEAVCAILAALYTGRAYSFLHPGQRAPRLRRMVERLRPSLVIDLGSTEPDHDARSLCRDIAPLLPIRSAPEDAEPLPAPIAPPTPDHAAYVLFTSGSTGEPRGVCVNHRNALLAQSRYIKETGLSAQDRVGSEVGFNFDVSTFDLFSTFSVGATLDLIPESHLQQPARLLDHIAAGGVTSLFTVPTVVRLMLHAAGRTRPTPLPSLRRLMLTGELIPTKLADALRQLQRQNLTVLNLYGATEFPWGLASGLDDTVGADANRFSLQADGAGGPVPLSLPESPDQPPGELILTGPGLMSGYIDEETPFESPLPQLGEVATGDFVSLATDGRLKLHGRRDRQVRHEGYRIELAEIESWIETDETVLACMVTYDPVTARFEASVVPADPAAEGEAWLAAVAARARAVLPAYMVPHCWRALGAVPQTRTGKKDYMRLAEAR